MYLYFFLLDIHNDAQFAFLSIQWLYLRLTIKYACLWDYFFLKLSCNIYTFYVNNLVSKTKIYSYVVVIMEVICVTNYIFIIKFLLVIYVHEACLYHYHSNNKLSYNDSGVLSVIFITRRWFLLISVLPFDWFLVGFFQIKKLISLIVISIQW